MTNRNLTTIVAEPAKQELIITREFDAPRELVFSAFTDPDLYVQWIGLRRLTTRLEIFEPRNGGSWRYIQTDRAGNTFAFHGVNHEVLPPERIIGTFEFEGLPETGHVLFQTARFEELPGNRTRLTAQSVFQSVEDRDGMMMADMEEGVNDSYERLDALLEKLQEQDITQGGVRARLRVWEQCRLENKSRNNVLRKDDRPRTAETFRRIRKGDWRTRF
jgi:uncharacterized protein YndB with AHSA1/START domain